MRQINRHTETKHDDTLRHRLNSLGLFHSWVVYTNAETGEVVARLIVPVIK